VFALYFLQKRIEMQPETPCPAALRFRQSDAFGLSTQVPGTRCKMHVSIPRYVSLNERDGTCMLPCAA
jgi:hypothetical protein